VDVGSHSFAGDCGQLLNPRDVFDKPVAAPVKGEFAGYVLVKSK